MRPAVRQFFLDASELTRSGGGRGEISLIIHATGADAPPARGRGLSCTNFFFASPILIFPSNLWVVGDVNTGDRPSPFAISSVDAMLMTLTVESTAFPFNRLSISPFEGAREIL
jgi:hypothetical protein